MPKKITVIETNNELHNQNFYMVRNLHILHSGIKTPQNYVPEKRGQENPGSIGKEAISFFEEGQWRGH